MSIFDKIKNYMNELNAFEDNISGDSKDIQAIYERNKVLEKEIAERTKQLEQVNKTLHTLQNIRDMMNSSTPLSKTFDTIVETIKTDFGYLFGALVELCDDAEKPYFITSSYTKGEFYGDIEEQFGAEVGEIKLLADKDGLLMKALESGHVLSTGDIPGFLKSILGAEHEDEILKIAEKSSAKSLIVLPIKPEASKDFGCMLVFSPRTDVSDEERKFLQIFARQIELACTIANLFEKVQRQAITDPLTELYNRRYFEESMLREAERSERLNQPFTLISLDLDHLKQINDTYGHNYGDIAIKKIGKVLKHNARSIDIPARIGGEEFNIMLPGIDSKGGMIAAERIRSAINAEPIEKVGHISASIGVATYIEHTKSLDELLEMGDQAMYKAKVNGRNRVVLAKEKEKGNWQQNAIDAFMDILSKQRIPVSKEISEEIRSKLERVNTAGATVKEILYSVSDTIAQSYDSTRQDGFTKQKIQLAVKLAKMLNMTKAEQDNLKLAMLLYDIGNTMIPDEIFKNQKPLNEEEKEEIHKHPVIAAKEILAPISSVAEVLPIIEKHHENWDGTGYPSKIKGEEIPMSSQIVLLVDSYSAQLQPRSYRPAMTKKEAIASIKSEAGKKWNKELVDTFVKLMQEE